MSRIILCCVIGLLVLTAGCSRSANMTVGSKAFTESVVLAEICATLAEQEGANVRHVRELGGTRVMWDALRAGEIDVYPEYTGTIEQEIYQGQSFASQAELKAALQRDGIVMSESLGFNNTYALGMRRDRARELGIETISDLREHPDLRLGFSNEFLDRGDGWPSVRAAYQLPQQKVTGLEHTLAYEALRNGGLDIIDLYATDPQIVADDLLVLKDDLEHFPQYDAVLLFRKDFANRKPALTRALLQLDGTISEQRMAELNRQVQLDRKSEHNVAAAFVHEQFGYETTRETSTLSSRLATTTAQHLWLVSILVGRHRRGYSRWRNLRSKPTCRATDTRVHRNRADHSRISSTCVDRYSIRTCWITDGQSLAGYCGIVSLQSTPDRKEYAGWSGRHSDIFTGVCGGTRPDRMESALANRTAARFSLHSDRDQDNSRHQRGICGLGGLDRSGWLWTANHDRIAAEQYAVDARRSDTSGGAGTRG